MKRLFLKSAAIALMAAAQFVPSFAFAQSPAIGVVAPRNSENLQNALRRIAQNSNDSSALADAGMAALELGDTKAAIGFLARAEQLAPNDGQVKAGLGRALLLEQSPQAALRYFDEATANGIADRIIAADRGLAYDLIGRNKDAQADYAIALRDGQTDELLQRYAISLGITGDVAAAESRLSPLLYKSDRRAWRTRAFILAMNGKQKEADTIAEQTMPGKLADAIKPFFDRMPKLTAAQKAAAVHFGHFPAAENVGVDLASVRIAANSVVRSGTGAGSGLIPIGQPLGNTASAGKTSAAGKRTVVRPGTSDRETRAERKLRLAQENAAKNAEAKEIADRIAAQKLPKDKPGQQMALAKPLPDPAGATRVAMTSLPEPAGVRPLVKPAIDRPDAPVTQIAQANAAPTPAPASVVMQQQTTSAELPAIGPAVRTVSPPPTTSEMAAEKPAQVVAAPTPASSTPLGTSSSPSPGLAAIDGQGNQWFVETSPGPVLPNPTSPVDTPGFATRDLNQPVAPTVAASDTSAAPTTVTNITSPDPASVAQSPPASLADIIRALEIPPEERIATVVAVDLSKITPARPEPRPVVAPDPAKPDPKLEKVDPKSAKAKKDAAKKVAAKKAEPANPKRHWVQLATGSDLRALAYDYRKYAKKDAKLFAGVDGWTSQWGKTKRLVVGPFDDMKAAKSFESAYRKGGGDAFAWISEDGVEVTKISGK